VRGRGLIKRRPGRLEIPGLEVSQRQLVARLREPGLELEDFLKLLDRLCCLALGEMHFSAREMPLKVRWALFEHGVECLDALVVLSLAQGDLGQAAPGGEELGSSPVD